jgi:glycosyltransferase involved in cell wall biosynthesis
VTKNNIDIEFLVGTLRKPAADIPKKERKRALTIATALVELKDHLSESLKSALESALQELGGHPDAYNGMLIESLLFSLTADIVHLHNITPYLSQYESDFFEASGTLMAVRSLLFEAHPLQNATLKTVFDRDFCRKLFDIQLAHIQRVYDEVAQKKRVGFSRNNVVAVLTPHFVGPPHAPSVDTLKFSKTLMTDFGKTVVIIVTSLCSYDVDGAIVPGVKPRRNDDLIGADSVLYDGLSIPFLFCGDGVLSDVAVRQCLMAIDNLSPEMILCVGEPAAMAEPFHERSFSFIYPLGHGLPLVKKNYFHVYSDPSIEETLIMQREGISERCLFTQQYDLAVKPPSSSLTREEFLIPEDSFVFSVVGMRLHIDVDETLLDMFEKIAVNDRAHFLFVGNFSSYTEKLETRENLRGRTTFIGFQDDIMAVHNITDVCINPSRSGGGTGVVYALQAELPVLSLSTGDGGLVTSAFPEVRDYDHMSEIAVEMIESPALLDTYRNICRREAPKFSGQLIARIITEFEKFAETRMVLPNK